MERDNLLIVTSKWPGKTNSSDGGNSTVRELVDILSLDFNIDIMYFGNNGESSPRTGIRKVIKCAIDFDHYESYSSQADDKFTIRLKLSRIAAEYISRYEKGYKHIIVIHNMFLLGMCFEDYKLINKIILFPMFTGEAYKKCGENVPKQYIVEETKVLKAVRAIISPSDSEKQILVEKYGVDERKVFVIHRCVDRFPYMEKKCSSEQLTIIYIASVRRQKAHEEAISLLQILKQKGINARLVCIGAIQDQDIYSKSVRLSETLGLKENVHFTGNLEQEEIEKYLEIADINISVSRWETFGRGIFEGLASGVPTVVLKRIENLEKMMPANMLPIRCEDLDVMSEAICSLMKDSEMYHIENHKGFLLREYLSTGKVRKQLLSVLEGEWSEVN